MAEYDLIKHAIKPDGGLFDLGWYLGWSVTDETATLDGDFTAQELYEIANYMQANYKPKE